MLRQADEVVYTSMTRNNKVFHIRDRWMVDNSSRVIGVFNGTYGGTQYTLDYAEKKGREIVLIEDRLANESKK